MNLWHIYYFLVTIRGTLQAKCIQCVTTSGGPNGTEHDTAIQGTPKSKSVMLCALRPALGITQCSCFTWIMFLYLCANDK